MTFDNLLLARLNIKSTSSKLDPPFVPISPNVKPNTNLAVNIKAIKFHNV